MPVAIDTDCPQVMGYVTSDFIQIDSLLAYTFLTSAILRKVLLLPMILIKSNSYGTIL